MPYKDPAREQERNRSERMRACNRKRSAAFQQQARAVRRLLRLLEPDRFDRLRALLTPEEAETVEAFAFRPLVSE
jgi:hypothetical protein